MIAVARDPAPSSQDDANPEKTRCIPPAMYLLDEYLAPQPVPKMNNANFYCPSASHDPVRLFGRNPTPRMTGGFSLVEVTLAIGIVAFAFVALFALLPVGMNTFKQAMDTSVTAQIAQRIAGELQESDYNAVLSDCKPTIIKLEADPDKQHGVLPRRFFDDQGNEIQFGAGVSPTSSQRAQRNVIYEAHIRISRARQLPSSDGSGKQARLESTNIITATIQVANNPSGAELAENSDLLFERPLTKAAFHTFPTVLARNNSLPQ